MLRHPYMFFRGTVIILRQIIASVASVLRTLLAIFAPVVLPLFSTPKIIAFRIINRLKPVYRDSLDTHGLSLFNGSPG